MMVRGETLLVTLITGILSYVSQKSNKNMLYIYISLLSEIMKTDMEDAVSPISMSTGILSYNVQELNNKLKR